ncbi:MAG: rhomboid family intramembrane serine protease [Sedimentisphaerales bacterium]|nr:rhomboid family intramembrane serine protease [Sedimentisphaerales bacterium]
MGFENRPYYRDQGGDWRPERPGIGRMLGLPTMGPMVKRLMIINVVVFILQLITHDRYTIYFTARGETVWEALQVWRLITFQFLHASFGHILFNMIALYFFGTLLERAWGSKRFLRFYLTCGAVGGVLFVVSNLLRYIQLSPLSDGLLGASGGVLGVMAACAILFPQVKVYLYFLFPIPIRVLALVITAGYVLNVFKKGLNYGGDICHLGGMATAAVWIFVGPYIPKIRIRRSKGAWERRMQQEEKLFFEADRILAKVHEQGINSLTPKEKDILQKATQLQQTRGRGPYAS